MKYFYNLNPSLLVYALLVLSFWGVLPAHAANITVDGTQRSFILYVPKNLGESRPLLISCHGMNQDANYQKGMLQIESVADTAKFLTVFPEGIDKSWDISGDRDIHFVTALIDKMVSQYKIDRNRVYLSGFSMGGMFTYHAMNKIADKIAAFAPISGYPMWGGNFTSSRPVPIIHTHGTSDDVVSFSGVQNILNGWIKRNGCSTTAKVTKNYRGASHITRHVWGSGLEGTEVVLMEMAGKGHWISNDNGVKTGDEIWRFCSRYSLCWTMPSVSITSPKSGVAYTSFAPRGEATFPDIEITAKADDPNGTVETVEFYDGTTLIATCTEAPYKATLTGAKSGKHTIKAVATDNDGETASASIELTLSAPQSFSLSSGFKTAGTVPAGWTTFDCKEKRVGYADGFSQGCRVLEFTGSPRGLDYGLYVRNVDGKYHQGWAKYGQVDAGCTLNLTPGHYSLRYKICNWNKPQFAPVELSIEQRSTNQSVASQTFTPAINIGNVASNSFGAIKQETFEFDITEPGDYIVAIYTAEEEWSDCIIGQLMLTAASYAPLGISDSACEPQWSSTVYDLYGHHIGNAQQSVFSSQLKKGLYIQGGKKIMVR